MYSRKEYSRKGYRLNMFCMSLNEEANRDEFRSDEAAYLRKHPMTDEQRQTVLDRNWLEMLRLGGNIYASPAISVDPLEGETATV